MDLTINQKDLSRMLARAASAAAIKSPISSLSTVLLEAKDGVLTARATDSYIGVDTRSPANVKESGSVALDAKKAADVAKALPVGEVRLRLMKTHVEVSSGKSKSKLPALPGDSFPDLPRLADDHPFATVKAIEFARAIHQGSYAMSEDDTRPHLNGALFEPARGAMRVVSTDGHRLAFGTSEVEGAFPKMMVPYRAVGDVRKLCESAKDGDIRVALVHEVAFFASGDTTLNVKVADQQFPPWEKLIPKAPAQRLQLPKDALVDAIRRVELFTDDKFTIKLAFVDGAVRISSQSDKGESDESIDCACDFELEMGMHSGYLKEAFSASIDDDVTVELSGALGPLVVVVNGYTAVCMPMRLA